MAEINEKLNIYQKLSLIQEEANIGKTEWNDFGGFYGRSAEKILEKLKPICKKYNTLILLSDEIEQKGDRYYVKANAMLIDLDSVPDCIQTSARAREAQSKAKMDEAQVTGSASSYARKYALGGLLALDDGKDPDTITPQEAYEKKKPPTNKPGNNPQGNLQSKAAAQQKNNVTQLPTKAQIEKLENMAKQKGTPMKSILDHYKRDNVSQLTMTEWSSAMNTLQKKADV